MFKTLKSLVTPENIKMVIIIRTDLNMTKGKIASQAAHVAVSLYNLALKSSNPYLKPWLNQGQPKIILKVNENSYNVLNGLYMNAIEKKLKLKLWELGQIKKKILINSPIL